MAACLTCRRRKVKCDGTPGVCHRCEKLGIQCLREDSSSAARSQPLCSPPEEIGFTQAGHRRIRIPAACTRCREKKLKCDAQQPACSSCTKKATHCTYGTRRRLHAAQPTNPLNVAVSTTEQDARVGITDLEVSHSRTRPSRARRSIASGDQSNLRPPPTSLSSASSSPGGSNLDNGTSPHSSVSALQIQGVNLPNDQAILPYLDSFLENVHPLACNNFLHPGCLCEDLDQAPPLLLLALCASSSKFMPGEDARQRGLRWAEEAKWLIMKSLDSMSTLTISAIQFLALHEVHQGQLTAASNLIGIAIRMTLELELHVPTSHGIFLEKECRRRLVWAVFVSDLLFNYEKESIDAALLMDLPLPCNIWSFTQGVPCRTLTLRQLEQRIDNTPIQQATNHCAYFISILHLRRKIFQYISTAHIGGDIPWLEGSPYQTLSEELRIWKSNLPPNYAFTERSLFMFRVSRHLDIFLMIHAYYHQCCIILSEACASISLSIKQTQLGPQPPDGFIQRCGDMAFQSATDIPLLIQTVLKVEPDHLFRDPWFGLCIWDATLTLLASSERQLSFQPSRAQSAESLKFNVDALRNTMQKIPLIRRIHDYVCVAIRHFGFDDIVDILEGEVDHITVSPELFSDRNSPQARYPFMFPKKKAETPGWDRLFRTTDSDGRRGATRQVSPATMPFEFNMDDFDANMVNQSGDLPEWGLDDARWYSFAP